MTVCMAPIPIIFDLDGTLIDSAPDIHACVNIVLREHHLTPLPLTQVRSFIGGGVDVLWQKIIAAKDIDPLRKGELIAAFMTRYHNATALTRLYPNVSETIGVLADRGHPLGICTNKPLQATHAILDHFGVGHLFGYVIGGDSLPQRKPDPAPVIATVVGLGADPANPKAIYVGDSEFDAAAAAAALLPFFLYTQGYRQTPVEDLRHQAKFDNFAALPALIADFTES